METVRTDIDERMSLPCGKVLPNDSRAFLVGAVLPEKGVQSELTFGPDGLTGSVTNRMGAELTDAIVLVNRQAYRVGNLADGKAAALTVGEAAKLSREEYLGIDVMTPADSLRNGLITQCVGRGRDADGQAVIIGWMDRSPLSPLGPNVPMPAGHWCPGRCG